MIQEAPKIFPDKSVTLTDSFEQVRELFVNVWQGGFAGISLSRIVLALAIFLLFLFIRGWFARFILMALRKWTKVTRTGLDDIFVEAFEQPLKMLPFVLGVYFATIALNPGSAFQELTDQILKSVVVYALFWSFYRAVNPLIKLMKPLSRTTSVTMWSWVGKVLKFTFVLVGASIILEIWGVNIAALLAGLGLAGAAVALATQDLIKNLIAGVLILAEKRFYPGEWIKVDGVVEGTVEEINLRSTRIRRFDKAPVYIPNGKLADNAVTNFTRMTHRRIYWLIGVEYKTTIKQLQYIRDKIMEYILESEDFAHPPEVATFVRIDRFSDSSIDFLLYSFTRTTNWGRWLEVKEALALRIKEIIEKEAGTSFAFPSQSIYLDKGVEVFEPKLVQDHKPDDLQTYYKGARGESM